MTEEEDLADMSNRAASIADGVTEKQVRGAIVELATIIHSLTTIVRRELYPQSTAAIRKNVVPKRHAKSRPKKRLHSES